MKKLLFSALACVAFAFSGFASNEVVSGITNVNLEYFNEEFDSKEGLNSDSLYSHFSENDFSENLGDCTWVITYTKL